MRVDRKEFDVSPRPAQPLTLLTVWPQLAAGAILVGVLAWAIASPSVVSVTSAAAAAFMFALTVAYLTSLQRGWRSVTSILTWVGGIVLSLFAALITPNYVPLVVLFVFAAVCYGLGASGRRMMYWGSFAAWGALAIALNIGLAVDASLLNVGLAQPPLFVKAGVLIVSLLLAADIMQRLWRHYNRTRAAFDDLRTANAKLNETGAELEQHVREQAELLDVTRVIGSTLDLNPLLDEILVQLKRVMRYGTATLLAVKDGKVHALRHAGNFGEHVTPLGSLLAETPHWSRVVEAAQPLIVPDVRADAAFAEPFTKLVDEQSQRIARDVTAWMGVPLIVRGHVIGMLALTHADSTFFSPRKAELALAFANQAAVAIEAARARDDAIAAATLTERQRLARELHDSVSQSLFGMVLTTRASIELIESDPARASNSMRYVLDLADAALSEMRALIFELRPESLQEDGLLTAFRKQAVALTARHKIRLDLDLCANEPTLPIEAKEALYRISMEAMQNTIRHAEATHLKLALTCEGGHTLMSVTDNGRGFDPTQSFNGHLGLKTMHERAELFGGTLAIDSHVGQGTTVQVSLPSAEHS